MKRFFATILTVFLLQSCIVCPVSADIGRGEADIVLLNKLGIEDISSQRRDEFMTREELAYFVYGISCGGKIPSENTEGVNRFADVSDGTYLANAANALYDMKVMFGTGDDMFEPNGNVSMTALATVILRAAGYGDYVKTENDAVRLAANLGLFKNVTVSDKAGVKIAEAASVAVNALDVKVVGDKDITEAKLTVLESYFGLYREDGVFYTGEAAGIRDDEIMLGGKKYDADAGDEYEAYNGLSVRAYIGRRDNKLAFIDTRDYDNSIFVVDAQDIISVDDNYLKYYGKSGKKNSISLRNITEIYNGKAVSFDKNDFIFKNGRIVFADTGDGKTARIERYDTVVAGAVSDGVVRDYYNPQISLDLSDEDDVRIILDGELVSADVIKKGNALSVARTKDGSKIKVYLSQKTLSGTVTSTGSDYFNFDRKKIYRSDYFAKNEKTDRLGENITLSIDIFGRAAAVLDNDTADSHYGYLVNVGANDAFGKPKVRIFDISGDLNTYSLSDNITVNGLKGGNTSDKNSVFMQALRTRVSVDNGNVTQTMMNDYVSQPIGYTINSKGQITSIDTAIKESGESDSSLEIHDTVYDRSFRPGGANQFNFSFRIGANTAAFYVPDSALNTFDAYGNVDMAKRNSVSDDDFRPALSVLGGGGGKYDATVYNLTDGGAAGVMVVDNKSVGGGSYMKSVDAESTVMLVEKVTVVKNRKGNNSYCVTGWKDGKQNRWIVAYPDEFLKDKSDPSSVVSEGDVIQISTDIYGEIDGFKVRYDYKNKKAYDDWEACNCYAGICYSYDDGGIVMRTDPESKTDEKIFSTIWLSGKTYVYDSEKENARLGTVDDIKAYKDFFGDASVIFVRANYNNPSTLVIYK